MSSQLGRYNLDRKLATGGMAEIWVAHQQGPAGFQKEAVVKKILPHLAEDPKFVAMFLDEARLAAQLSHPNIVQIFELGDVDGNYFIAMEFIDGRDVQAIVDRAAETGRRFSPAIAARIVADACTALDYAHNFTARDGTSLQLVHRDVSPQNILVSNDGIVKLVDFGVAKAATSQHKTQTGAVKGKLSYMSPEQISGQRIDARSDLFALGIVLYELVTGRRPFGHESELLAITAILNEHPPRPCELIQELPVELESVILRALEKDPDQRFQSASEMQMALETVLRDLGAILTAREVRAYIEDLFSDAPTGSIPALEGIAYDSPGAVTQVQHPSAQTRPEFAGVPDAGGAPAAASSAAVSAPAAQSAAGVRLHGALADAASRQHDATAPASRPVARAALLMLLLLGAVAVSLFLIFGPGAKPEGGDGVASDAPPQAAPNDEPGLAGDEHTDGDEHAAAVAAAGDDDDEDVGHSADAPEPLADAGAALGVAGDDDDGSGAAAHADGSGAGAQADGSGAAVEPDGSGDVAADPALALAPEAEPTEPASDDEASAEESADDDATASERGDDDDDDEEAEERPRPRARTGEIQIILSRGGQADVYVDGRRVGTLPGNRRFEVPAGRRTVRVDWRDGHTASERVEVDGGDSVRVRLP